ncbi:MAG: hypothetical protein Kow001_21150 [Acidobacteriota bacterium]
MRRGCLFALSFLTACTAAPVPPEPASPPSAAVRPNVLLISIDTLRADHLSCYGNTRIHTPALDRLAAEGILFERAFTPVPITLPAHASLLTGTYPLAHGVRDNSGFVLPDAAETLAEALRREGYATAAFVGSFVLDSRFGLDQGFSHYFDDFQTETLDLVRQNIQEHPAEMVLQRARESLEPHLRTPSGATRPPESGSSRWFVWIHLFDPHAPYAPPETFRPPANVTPYEAEVLYVDRQLGGFLDVLCNRPDWAQTLVILTSDHGEGLGAHGEDTHGIFLYDSTLHVPLIFRLPGGSHGGQRVARQVRLIDVFPTVLQILGLPPSPVVQGEGLAASWLGRGSADLDLYCETLMPQLSYGWSALSGLRSRQRKFIDAPRPELYDLEADPGELHNLAEASQADLNRLRQEKNRLRDLYSAATADSALRSVDAATTERLRSLGYVGVSAGTRLSPAPAGADPKDKIAVFNRIWEAQAAAEAGEITRSIQILDQIIAAEPDLFVARSLQSLNHLRQGRPQLALANLEAAARLRPEDPGSHLYLGMTYLQVGRPLDAVREFELTLGLEPANLAALNNLAAAYVQLGRREDAARIFQRVLEQQPQDVAALVNLGVIRMLQERPREALPFFQRALELQPDLPQVHNNIGLILLGEGRTAEAIRSFEQALRLQPDYAAARANLERARGRQ